MAKRSTQHYCGIGGQAVLEGVMMKHRNMYAVAVRRPDQEVEVEVDEYHGILEDTVWVKIPFIRGIFVFLDSLILGMRALNLSASYYEDENEKPTAADKVADEVTGGRGEKILAAVTVVISFALAIGLFVVLPYWISTLLGRFIRSASLLAIVEGAVRILIFLIYIVAITAMKDIRRLYMYHGAEHKCINCLESGEELTVENVRRASRFHKRCGSSFIVFVVLVSVVLFFFIRVDNPLLRILLRIALIPVIAGISYELIRLAGRSSNPVIELLSLPGLWTQRLTTKEPDDQMIEVGIASVEAIYDWKSYLREEFPEYYEEEEDWDA